MRFSLAVVLLAIEAMAADPVTIWKASAVYSYPARVVLRKSDDYQAILSGVPDSVVVDSIYWVEECGGNFVLRGSEGATVKIFPCSQYAIIGIEEVR